MSKLISTFFLLSLLPLSACSTVSDEPRSVVRFALRDDYVDSWEEAGGGFKVHLNTEGQRKLIGLTRTHPGSEMEIYAGRVLLTSETIHGTLRGDNLFVAVEDDRLECAMAELPPAKKAG